MGWYVVETELKRETVAQDCIHELGLPTFLPQMRRATRSHHRYANPYIPIFPRYIFVQFDLSIDRHVWPAIRRQRGVRNILGSNPDYDRIPSAVRDTDFTRLQILATELCREVALTNEKPTPLAKDTVIRILWGPLTGKAGVIEFDNGVRADVLLATAGVASKISLPRELIEAAT